MERFVVFSFRPVSIIGPIGSVFLTGVPPLAVGFVVIPFFHDWNMGGQGLGRGGHPQFNRLSMGLPVIFAPRVTVRGFVGTSVGSAKIPTAPGFVGFA